MSRDKSIEDMNKSAAELEAEIEAFGKELDWKQRAEAAEAKLDEQIRTTEGYSLSLTEAEAELAECRGDLESHKWAADRVVAAEAEVARLREALKWYSDSENYRTFEVGYGDFWGATESDTAWAFNPHEDCTEEPWRLALDTLAQEQDDGCARCGGTGKVRSRTQKCTGSGSPKLCPECKGTGREQDNG